LDVALKSLVLLCAATTIVTMILTVIGLAQLKAYNKLPLIRSNVFVIAVNTLTKMDLLPVEDLV
jgi:hypothetical protein